MRRLLTIGLLAALSTTGCVAGPTTVDQVAVQDLGQRDDPAPDGGQLAGGVVTAAQWESVVGSVRTSVVRVRNRTCDGLDTGSGFVLSRRTLVTNAHVVKGAKVLSVDTSDGASSSVTVADVATDEDLAVVHTREELPPALTVAATDPTPGDPVQALGYPLGKQFTAAPGRVVGFVDGAQYQHEGRVLESSVTIHPGNSGGPLIDRSGTVVGVVFAIDLRNGSALVIPASRVRSALARSSTAPARPSC